MPLHHCLPLLVASTQAVPLQIIGIIAHATTRQQRQQHYGHHPFLALAMDVVNINEGEARDDDRNLPLSR
jgi:hypothetical protein